MKNLGKLGKDKITGFTGIITGRCDYLYGCGQYGLNPEVDKDGKIREMAWFDIGRVEIIGEGIDPDSVKSEDPGCEYREHPL
jgi:hypothetical protein